MTESPRVLLIDDSEPAIAYSQPEEGHHWTQHIIEASYNRTAHLTRTRGASARFKFEGSNIAVHGRLDSDGRGLSLPVSRYSVDDGPSMLYAPTLRTEQQQVAFFSSGALGPGNHTLFIVNESEGAFLWIDFFMITQNVQSPTSASSSVLCQKPPLASIGIEIAGGLLASLGFYVLLVCAYCWSRRRSQQKHGSSRPRGAPPDVTTYSDDNTPPMRSNSALESLHR
ncbi:hypothetical protein FA15DRAFT_412019 [Coprinopsis marcescibilis]|uniref:Transmembrane protein n=1 Tax=Coprinopsis marcescibilis TaxID=230819 RepID=A0A5C3KV98_COPMA|nr:hypothetical protein FA15DRAFT_412019 [Coprinopsis marcescibilis]